MQRPTLITVVKDGETFKEVYDRIIEFYKKKISPEKEGYFHFAGFALILVNLKRWIMLNSFKKSTRTS